MTIQANMSVAAQVARAGGGGLAALEQATGDWRALLRDWSFWADKRQLPPDGDWRTWVIMAGRGFGKTRAGAEWVRAVAENPLPGETVRIALVGATMEQLREDRRGLRVIGRIEGKGPVAQKAMAMLRAGRVDGLSFGYRVVKGRAGRVRELQELELVEVSVVATPMQPLARVHMVEGYWAWR